MKLFQWNERKKTVMILAASLLFILLVLLIGFQCTDAAGVTDFMQKNELPSLSHPFGTDWLGRDMFARTMKGLSISILIGTFAAAVSALIALGLGIISATFGRATDAVIGFGIDLIMGIPHMLLLILISVAAGRGENGVVLGIALTHWTSLARVVRGEILQISGSPYIKIAERLGHGKIWIAARHMFPQVFPQFIVGLLLMFPHAILHESGVTFLGFGLTTEQPAIGIILSESMKYLITGKWWLALFPGFMLTITVLLFDAAGESIRKLCDPASAHE